MEHYVYLFQSRPLKILKIRNTVFQILDVSDINKLESPFKKYQENLPKYFKIKHKILEISLQPYSNRSKNDGLY